MKNLRRKKNCSRLKSHSQRGQIIIEYILLLVIIVGLSSLVRNYLVQSRFLQTFTFQPWAKLDGMIQCGVWIQCGLSNPTAGMHPDSASRTISPRPL
jgi:hypothetical protein